MIGKIRSLSAASGTGLIAADNGRSFHFRLSVVEPLGATLSIGQWVTFEVQDGRWPGAINVRVAAEGRAAGDRPAEHPAAPRTSGAVAGKPGSILIQYMGFDQTANIRTYRFDRLAPGEETREFTVSADLELFAKHHVGIQEGPALSLGRVQLALAADASDVLAQSLTDADMLGYLESRPATREKIGRRALASAEGDE